MTWKKLFVVAGVPLELAGLTLLFLVSKWGWPFFLVGLLLLTASIFIPAGSRSDYWSDEDASKNE